MGFFQTVWTGYKIIGAELKLGWKKHGAQFLTGGGTGLMLIASGLMARKGCSEEVQQAIAEANVVIDEIQRQPVLGTPEAGDPVAPEVAKKETRKKKFRLAKAKTKKLWTVGKHFWKEAAVDIVGAVAVGAGQHMNTTQKTALATAAAGIATEFAAYRANVIADQGEEKDLEYLTTKTTKGAKRVTMNNGTVLENNDPEGGDVTVKADPNAFKFWFSPETCPGRYYDNLDMTKNELEFIEDTLTRKLRMTGHLYLNDMRREFGGLTPDKMDVPIGGIMGLTCDRSNPNNLKTIDLGWRKDLDFMEGRKVGVWIIFPCDPAPIIAKMKPKQTAIEGNYI